MLMFASKFISLEENLAEKLNAKILATFWIIRCHF